MGDIEQRCAVREQESALETYKTPSKGTKLRDISEVGEAIEASPSMSADKAVLTEEQILGLI